MFPDLRRVILLGKGLGKIGLAGFGAAKECFLHVLVFQLLVNRVQVARIDDRLLFAGNFFRHDDGEYQCDENKNIKQGKAGEDGGKTKCRLLVPTDFAVAPAPENRLVNLRRACQRWQATQTARPQPAVAPAGSRLYRGLAIRKRNQRLQPRSEKLAHPQIQIKIPCTICCRPGKGCISTLTLCFGQSPN